MNRASTKAERLLQIEALLLSFPEGLTQAEIARRLGVHRATIHRYLPDLTREFCIYEAEDGRLAIDRDHYLTNVRLTLHESAALHLAARLMATRTDKQNPHAAAALRKLGIALEKLAPQVARHLKASAAVMDDQARRHDPVYLAALETLTRAWSDGRVAHVWHRMADGRVFDYEFSPYFIEPYAVGQTAHVIGWREPPGALRTFKLERIQRAELTGRSYTVPADFDPQELLWDAWGIWYTEAEPVEVALRFHPRVAGRVRETRWHRSEEVTEEPDGHLLWRARVAEPQEMLPWIRGWGADVEVVEPAGLRQELVRETRRLAARYHLQPIPGFQSLWAKAERGTGVTHPLICHMIDVAQVARALWERALTEGARQHLSEALGLNEEAAGRTIAFWAGLHDLGKATPGFQRKYAGAQPDLEEAGLEFPPLYIRTPFNHAAATTVTLPALLESECALPDNVARQVAQALGGHHGSWPVPLEIKGVRGTQLGDTKWETARRGLVSALASLLEPVPVSQLGANRTQVNGTLTLLSGLVTAADWIGSMERFFPFASWPVEAADYAERSGAQARRALEALEWTRWAPPSSALAFEEIFPWPPRPMQRAVIELARSLDGPALVIIEAPTGTGKTEAALYLSDHFARVCQQRGLYVAMPTMATSNQMFGRVGEYLARRYPEGEIGPLLIHSQARRVDDLPSMHLEDDSRLAALTWFLPRKRSLLAPIGVGTVDQALMSILQTRHFFLRLFGLGHKTVVFDEVHAYDTYMTTLFERLLGWLSAVGASVVILSATLPATSRRELLKAFGGPQTTIPEEVTYPAVCWVMRDQAGTRRLPAPRKRTIALEWVERDPQALADRLEEGLAEGGCAAVICNTVGRAQAVHRALREAGVAPPEDLMLFHARFPFAWREGIEREVLARFGKGSTERGRAVVVATQVIEQSLDLDFDLLVSDMAPVDLLIQRAGRLHRHDRPHRPGPLDAPRLWLSRPEMEGEVPDFGNDEYVYERYILLRSYLALDGRERLSLPADTAGLIRFVYELEEAPGAVPAMQAALQAAVREKERAETREVRLAQQRLVPSPGSDRLLRQRNQNLAEEDPTVHRALQALTRLIRPSVSVVCLHRLKGALYLEPEGEGPVVDLNRAPDADLTRHLARHALSVSHGGLVPALLEIDPPAAWAESPVLQHYRPLVFDAGTAELEGSRYRLHLNRTDGLAISGPDT